MKNKRLVLYKAQQGRCFYCRKPCEWTSKDKPLAATVDHVVPKSAGGSNSIDNLVMACRRCNVKKGCKEKLSMNTFGKEELIQKLCSGVQVRRITWPEGIFIYFDKTRGIILNQDGIPVETISFNKTNWEVMPRNLVKSFTLEED